MTGRARAIGPDDLHDFDWILAMDRENLADIRSLVPLEEPPGLARIVLFSQFCREYAEDEVPDPYYGGREGFERVLDLLEDGCAGIVEAYNEGRLA